MFVQTILTYIGIFLIVLLIAAIVEYFVTKHKDNK